MRRARTLLSTILAAFGVLLFVHAASADDFFAGKTITISTYDAPGGNYSIEMQAMAQGGEIVATRRLAFPVSRR